MDEENLVEYTFNHIISDYKALYNLLYGWSEKKIDYFLIANILPTVNLVVAEGYDFLVHNHYIIPSMELDKQMANIKDQRAKSIKLYEGFKQSTYNSINKFNREEYLKFFHKQFPQIIVPYIAREINNYFIAFVFGKPITNYHYLSKKIFDFEMGSYIEDITHKVFNYTSEMSNFLFNVLNYFGGEPSPTSEIGNIPNWHIKYSDLNVAFDYDNFNIVHNPPILMALLDVLCSLNFYIEIFAKINNNFDFDLKVKYIFLFYALISIRDILHYCDETKYTFPFKDELQKYVEERDRKLNNGKLRKICMHYDYTDFIGFGDPFKDAFERFFDINIVEVSKFLNDEVLRCADFLDKAIFKYHIR